ncbi:50S ribosomal protein L22 [Fervidicoccus fontis]|uniref:Large ribosomal subunit protein uL22 n=1 Tax=Fervidicoccus fontis (strain DSM 19380 / JCM 18336 / VKM B-2539 / Kam940) TaxID=1163730 RepID=I0A0J8_FERFK|nr:50S ribosomal protein L22 [Fervidicoccus fontis]AFH42505.1 50S ribosomal protein L22P [Fervidicoccus fontis Kam940]
MGGWNYSLKLEDESKIAKAVMRDLPISPKKVHNLARAVNGMMLQDAKKYLERVIAKEEAVPHFIHRKKIPHHKGLSERWGIPVGKYPVKAAKFLLKALNNVEANAESKELDAEKLKIIHLSVQQGYTLKRYMPRAFGRSTPKFKRYSNIEVIVKEV